MAEEAAKVGAGDGAAGETGVFVSYARSDSIDDALSLVEQLRERGFRAYLDQQDIAPGEDWEKRLGELVLAADAIVFIITPASVASRYCRWEIEEAQRLSKRLIPVYLKHVPDEDIPQDWSRRNFIFADGSKPADAELDKLFEALRTDIGWVREHTRLGMLAERWEDKRRSAAAPAPATQPVKPQAKPAASATPPAASAAPPPDSAQASPADAASDVEAALPLTPPAPP